jgi:GNAT superfamily N-acetyltransferase
MLCRVRGVNHSGELTPPALPDRLLLMDFSYFKRFRMEIKLAGRDLVPTPAPDQYQFVPWEPTLLDAFAQAKYLSFRHEMDASVFPCLSNFTGCRRLMTEIARKPGFLPQATWLVVCRPVPGDRPAYCGTVQGVRDRFGLGAIQNLGIAHEHRCRGLGMSLLLRSLAGFRQAGVRRVNLEVTAENQNAIRLYRRAGFSTVRTVYKAIETAPCHGHSS